MADAKPVGVAVVGIGRWCWGLAGAIHRSKLFKIVTCFTRTKEKRDQFVAAFQCDQETSYEDVVKRPDVEGVVIVAPNNAHAELTVLAAQHGKHVLVEKPMANRVPEARRMTEACQKNGVILSVLHNQRRLAGYRKIKSMIEAGSLGKVVMAETCFSHNGGFRLTPQFWRWFFDECPGGPVMTLGVHHADTLQYLLGPVQSVSSFFNKLVLSTENIDVGAVIMQFESGAIGYLGSNYVSPWANHCSIYGTEANAYFTVELPALVTTDPTRYGDNWNYGDRNSELYIRRKGEDQKIKVDLDPGEIITEEVEEFAKCIRSRKAPEVGGKEGMRSMAVILAAVRSSKSGAPVKIADILSE